MSTPDKMMQRGRAANFGAAVAILLGSFAYFGALAPYGLNVDDEGTLLYQIYRTYVGQLLYVDFHAGYTPGVFAVNAALLRLGGVNVLVLRFGLAVVNALSVVCLYLLARRLGTSRVAAAAGALSFPALIPFYDGQFAAFNIPYPIWYVTLFWLLAVLCVIAWLRRRFELWWLLAGLSAGIVFSFKPNSGLLCLAGLLMALARLQQPERVGAEHGTLFRTLALVERWLRWIIPLALSLGLTLFYARGAGFREVQLFALPLLLFVGLQLVRSSRPYVVAPMTLWRALILLGTGAAIVVLPWTVYFWDKLGTQPFLRAILFVGTGFDKFYYLAHPPLGTWGLGLAAALMLAAVVAAGLRRGVVPRWSLVLTFIAGLGLGGAALVLNPPRMVEGLQLAVVSRVRDVAFALVLAVEWGALLAYMFLTRRARRLSVGRTTPPDPRLAVLSVVLVSAVLMHMQLYPRSDYMHLVPACPLLLVLGAWLLDHVARWSAVGLAESRRGRLAVACAVVVPVYLLLWILTLPALRRIEYLVRAQYGDEGAALVRLRSDRAPLLLEPGAAPMFESLNAANDYLLAGTRLNEEIFTFPVLDILCFLTDRHNATRHGYFFPGWPGHAVEAEVIDALEERPPRYVVTLHSHALYFAHAPIYYFNLRRHVLTNYRLEKRLGLLDVLRYAPPPAAPGSPAEGDGATVAAALPRWRAELAHQGGATARHLERALRDPRAESAAGLADVIAGLDPKAQRRLARLIRKSRSGGGVAALAHALTAGTLGPIMRDVANRAVAEIGDAQSLPPILAALPDAVGADREMLAGLLYNIANKLSLENYWYGAPERRELARSADGIDVALLIQWIDNPWEGFALRSFAIRFAGRIGRREVVPFLARIVGDGDDWPDLRVQAAQSLHELGYGVEMLDPIIGLLPRDRLGPAALTAALYPRAPTVGRSPLINQMESPADLTRPTAFWIAAGVGDSELLPALLSGLADPQIDVRLAAAWGLGRLQNPAALPALQAALTDASDEVVRAASVARRRIESAETSRR